MNKKTKRRVRLTENQLLFLIEASAKKLKEEELKEEEEKQPGQHEKFGNLLKMLGGADPEGKDLWSMSDWLSGI
jgi:hypothetical protein